MINKDDELRWEGISFELRNEMFKYLKLLKRFKNQPSALSFKHKKWVLENSDLPTYLIPKEVLEEESLFL